MGAKCMLRKHLSVWTCTDFEILLADRLFLDIVAAYPAFYSTSSPVHILDGVMRVKCASLFWLHRSPPTHPPSEPSDWGSELLQSRGSPQRRLCPLQILGTASDAEAEMWDAAQRVPRIEAKLWHDHPRRKRSRSNLSVPRSPSAVTRMSFRGAEARSEKTPNYASKQTSSNRDRSQSKAGGNNRYVLLLFQLQTCWNFYLFIY